MSDFIEYIQEMNYFFDSNSHYSASYMVESHADWTLQQYSDYLVELCNVDASLSILCRSLHLIFIDETGFWVGMSRHVARSLTGKKSYNLRKFYKGRKMTLIGAMSIEGVVATKAIEGSMKGEDFYEFMERELVPHLRQGHVIVMDNSRAHKMERIEELVAGKGAKIAYLSPYSPEFNPIEMLLSVLKAFVRKFISNSMENLEQLIDLSLLLIDKALFKNVFVKCCYCASELKKGL